MAQVGVALSATVLAATLSFSTVDAAKADIAGLTPCSESKAFQKRQKNEVKALTKRLKQVHVCLSFSTINRMEIQEDTVFCLQFLTLSEKEESLLV